MILKAFPKFTTIYSFILSTFLIHQVNGNHTATAISLKSDNSHPDPSLVSSTSEPTEPITMSIYYETLCPDSLNFLQHQLLPLLVKSTTKSDSSILSSKLTSHSDHVDIESLLDIQLIPYGKAVTLETPETTRTTFLCQHGPIECEGNKLHSCALDTIAKTLHGPSSVTVTKSHLVNFMICTMEFLITFRHFGPQFNNLTSFSEEALDYCFSELSNATKLKAEIESCIQDVRVGSYLLQQNGELTNSLDPKLYFVPWITYNGVWTKRNHEQNQKDVKKVLCSFITPQNIKFYKFFGCQKYVIDSSVGLKSTILKHKEHSTVFDSSKQGGGKISKHDDNGVRNNRPIRRTLLMKPSPVSRPGHVMSGGRRARDRRRFLHSNNDMGLGQGGESWRWRTSVHANPNLEWRSKIPIALAH